MNHLFSLKSRPKRASFRSESEVARALRPRNFLAEEKRSLLLLLDWDVEYSAVSVGAAGGTAAATAVVTVVDFAIIIEYRVSREPCNNILQPTCTFDFWGFLDFRFRYHTQKGKHYEITFLIFHFCTIIWFILFLFVLHVTTSPISFLCLRTPYLHHVLPTTTAFVSHQSYSSVNHLLQCFCLFVCICLFDFFCKYTPLHITYLPISCLLLHYISRYCTKCYSIQSWIVHYIHAKMLEKNMKENEN